MALLIAMMTVLNQVLGIETQLIKMTFSFIPELIMAVLFGPVWTGIGTSIADLAGLILLPKAPYFFGFTVNAFVSGMIYGFFFYKKSITVKRAFFCVLTTTIIVTLVLTSIWLVWMYGLSLTNSALWTARILKALINLPVQTIIILIIGKRLPIKYFTKKIA